MAKVVKGGVLAPPQVERGRREGEKRRKERGRERERGGGWIEEVCLGEREACVGGGAWWTFRELMRN